MRKRESTPPSHRGTGRRDVLFVVAAAGVLFALGVAAGSGERLRHLTQSPGGADLMLLAVVALVATGALAIRRHRLARVGAEPTPRGGDDLHALITESPAVSYSWVPDEDRYLYVSPQIEQLFGVTPRDHMEDWAAQIVAEDRDRVVTASDAADRDRTPCTLEYRITRPDGTVRWIHDESHFHQPDEHGRPIVAQGVLYDITERKEAEARALAAEERYRTLVERVPAIAYSWDTAFAPGTAPADYISPQIGTVLGVPAESWLHNPEAWTDHVHPDDVARVIAAWQAATDSNQTFSQEYRLRTATGAWLWVRDEANPVGPGAHGSPIYQGVIVDMTARHHAEEELREAETRWRELLTNLPIVAYQISFDADGRSRDRWVAPSIESLVGVPVTDWLADDDAWNNLIHPADRDEVLAGWRMLKTEGRPFDARYRMLHRSGADVWVHDQAVMTERNGVRMVEGAFADITAHRLAEDALGLAEDRFRTLVDQLPAITYIEDAETGLETYISPQVETVYGYTPEEWIAEPKLWQERLHPEDRDRVVASNEGDIGDDWNIDYRSITRDGRVIWVHNDAHLIRDADGTPRYWQGVVYDITERKDAEERLREAEERYRSLIEQLPVAVYTDAVDEVATALYISPQYEELTGYSPEQRLRDPDLWVHMLHPDDRDRVLEESDRTNASGEPFDTEYRIIAADGRVVWLHDHAVQVRDANGNPCWQGVLQDVTENRMAADAIARRDAILEATSFAAERFLRSPSWQEHLLEVLARLGHAGGASRCALWRNEELPAGALGVRLVEAWIDHTVGEEAGPSTQIFAWEAGGLGRWAAEFAAGRPIHGDVRDFPAAEQEALRVGGYGVRSLIAIPVVVAGTWWGYISVARFDDHQRWVDADVEALALTASTIGAAIEREITGRELQEAQARYRTLIEQIPAVTYIEDVENGDEIFSSPQTQRLLGYAPAEWGLSNQWEAALHPDDRERALAANRAADEAGGPFHCEYRLRHKDGHWVWVRDEAVLVRDADGSPRFWQGVRFDITAEKESEQHLRQAEERYRAIVEHVPAAIYLDRPDADMETIYISPQIEEIAGVSPERWMADPEIWLSLMDPAERDALRESYLASIRERLPWRAEYRIRRPDGKTVWIHDETTFLHDGAGEPALLQGVVFDITERKLAEQALRESEQRERDAAERLRALDEMKNTFLAAVSHELRSPLTSILGLSLTLERTPDLPESDRNDLLVRLAVNARKLDQLLKDLLDIDRLHRGIVEPQYRTTDVAALARRTIEHLDGLAGREVIVASDPVVMPVDPPKIERIVENLLINAVRHTAPDRRIWLTVRPHEGGVRISVEDDGPGVPGDMRSEIFEPFRQGMPPSTHAPGTGIGLSLVARFAELHGGRAWVDERAGGGAAFHVFIPGRLPNEAADTSEAEDAEHADAG